MKFYHVDMGAMYINDIDAKDTDDALEVLAKRFGFKSFAEASSKSTMFKGVPNVIEVDKSTGKPVLLNKQK